MDDLLQQGITAYRAGKRDEARKFFAGAVKQNQNDEHSWGWMYNVCDSDKERVYCLKQMLRINPKNEKANQLLSKLTAADFLLEQPSIPQTNLESQSIMEQNPPSIGRMEMMLARGKSQSKTEQKPPSVSTAQTEKNVVSQKTSDPTQQKNLQIGIGAVLFICIICLCIIFIPNLNKSSIPPTTAKKQLTVPVGQLSQYVDTYSNYDEVFVTKKDGSLDARPNDLEELCLDMLYYRKKIIEYTQSGETDKADEARISLNRTNAWLNAYDENDIGYMWTIIEKRNK
jgi:hypothetical protein